jgi:hypothetical protein
MGKTGRVFLAGTVLSAVLLASKGVTDRRFVRRAYEVESVEAPTFTVEIPKGWSRPDYSKSWESRKVFAVSTQAAEPSDPLFVFGTLSITDEGPRSEADVIAEWRKGQPNSEIGRVKLGELEAAEWRSELPMADLVGEARTLVFRASNGRVYGAHYQRARGRDGLRQDYVFGRVIASMKFKPGK